MILDRDFYARDTLTVARELLGKYLVRVTDGVPRVGRICETEGYIGRIDKACHAYGYRRTRRTETLFAAPGTAYVYLIYGMYHCLNLVTEPEGEPCAVLIRGIEARGGLPPEYLGRHRLNGPGKLCRALEVTRAHNGLDTTAAGELTVCTALSDVGLPDRPEDSLPRAVRETPRIGIPYAEEAVEFPWRFIDAIV